MKRKRFGKITMYEEDMSIKLDKKIGLVPAIIVGAVVGIYTYELYRDGVGGGCQTILNMFKAGELEDLKKEV